tara:strand:+ start:98 stop:463 length:366 start_codon:yes stop_codon:yes gene_type:complete
MKKLITLITIGSLLFGGITFAQPGGDGGSDRERKRPGKLPRILRGDEVLAPLFEQFKADRAAFRTQFSDLRKQIADATDEEKDALVASIKELRKHNKGAQRDFRRTMRARLKELRVARNAR